MIFTGVWYCFDVGVTKWVKGWKKNGWCLKSGGPVQNKDELQQLDVLLNEGSVTVKWVCSCFSVVV